MRINEIINKYESPEAFIKAVEEQLLLLAKEQPDFRYNTSGVQATCRYNAPAVRHVRGSDRIPAGPDCKGCIFGQALQNLGWDEQDELNTSSTIDSILSPIRSIRLAVWRDVQTAQDNGKTWSEAVSLLSANAPATGESNVE